MEFVSLIWLLLESSKFRLLFFKSDNVNPKKKPEVLQSQLFILGGCYCNLQIVW